MYAFIIQDYLSDRVSWEVISNKHIHCLTRINKSIVIIWCLKRTELEC